LCITPACEQYLYFMNCEYCFVLFCAFFLLQHTDSSQSQSSYNNNNKTRNQILQSLPTVRSTATANRQQLASFKGPMKAR
jgi:hypothetical protein